MHYNFSAGYLKMFVTKMFDKVCKMQTFSESTQYPTNSYWVPMMWAMFSADRVGLAEMF